MITNDELRTLKPGDQIGIISEDEARAGGYWDGEVAGWVSPSMNWYCGKVLTVRKTYPDDNRVYVEENSFWWRNDFIGCVVPAEEYTSPTYDEILSLLA